MIRGSGPAVCGAEVATTMVYEAFVCEECFQASGDAEE